MSRLALLLRGLLLAALLLPGAAWAADALVVRTSDLAPYKRAEASFRTAWGKPVKTLDLSAGSEDDVKNALGEGPPLVFAIGPAAAKAVAEAHPSMPFVYGVVPNPESLGLSGKSVGIPMSASAAREVSAIKELAPNAKRLGVLFDPSQSQAAVNELKKAASAAGLEVNASEVHSEKEVANAARDVLGKCDVFVLVPDGTVVRASAFKFLLQTSLEAKVPLVAFAEAMAKAGATLAVEASYDDIGKKAAEAGRRMVAGGAASAEAPDAELFLNAKSADRCGIALPDKLRKQAAKVYE